MVERLAELETPLSDLQPSMVLSQDLVTERGILLLSKEYMIRQEDLK